MARRDWTDEERGAALAVLAANGGNALRTAQQTGVPRQTLQRWASGEAVTPETEAACERAKCDLAEGVEEVLWGALDALAGKVTEMNGRDLSIAVGILSEKLLLLRGQPTVIQREVDLPDEEAAERVATLLQSARDRAALALSDGRRALGTAVPGGPGDPAG